MHLLHIYIRIGHTIYAIFYTGIYNFTCDERKEMMHVTRSMLHPSHHMHICHITCHNTCYKSDVTYHTSHTTCHPVSHATCHISHITFHTLHVTCHTEHTHVTSNMSHLSYIPNQVEADSTQVLVRGRGYLDNIKQRMGICRTQHRLTRITICYTHTSRRWRLFNYTHILKLRQKITKRSQ